MSASAIALRVVKSLRRQSRALMFARDDAFVRLQALSGRGPAPVRMLLASDELNDTSEQQFAPFRRFASALRHQIGLVSRHLPVSLVLAMSPRTLRRYDLIGLKLSFQTSADEALKITMALSEAVRGSRTRLIIFDGDDDLNILWPETLAIADLYVKKHVYRDRNEYALPRQGKSNLTDYVARKHGRTFADNEIPASRPFDPALTAKLFVGWNIGIDDKIVDLAHRMPLPPTRARPVDVVSRAYAPPELWIHPLRDPVARGLEAMGDEMRVSVPHNRVDQDEYYREMLSATICVSPFGYGEICWRDFEAVICGCLLVKPDMGHVETRPDIYVAGETYAPVRWDYADLNDVCRQYRVDTADRQRMIKNAQDVIRAAQKADWFVNCVSQMLQRLA